MDVLTGGINMTMSKYAGLECIEYVNQPWRTIETFLILAACLCMFCWSYPKCLVCEPSDYLLNFEREDTGQQTRRKILLVVVCLCWGMEIGFKCASKTLIYLLNPCHITTAMQIYMLSAEQSRTVTSLFRIHLNYLNGPLLAIVFYETETRMFPLEAAVYWIQHLLMFVVAYNLMHIEGYFSVERRNEFQWNVMSYSLLVAYHFIILQNVSVMTDVNMNHIMCPLDSDPFKGQFYRTAVFIHQALFCILVSKIFTYFSRKGLASRRFRRVQEREKRDRQRLDEREERQRVEREREEIEYRRRRTFANTAIRRRE